MAVTWGALTLPLACIEPDLVPTAVKEIDYPGVDGEQRMDLGKRARSIRVSGRLIDAIGGTPNAEAITDIDTGVVATLADSALGLSFSNCRAVRGSVRGFRKAKGSPGLATTCEYEIEFEQIQGF